MGLGVFSTNYLVRTLDLFPYFAILFSVLVCGLLNLICYRTVFRTVIKKGCNPVQITLASMGLLLVLSGIGEILDYLRRQGPMYYSVMLYYREYDIKWFGLPLVFVFSTVVMYSLLLSSSKLMKTLVGLAFRSIIENTMLAQVQGVNPERIGQITWFISGCLAGLAGGIHPLLFHSSYFMGTWIINSVLAASLVWGSYSIFSGIKGGLTVGILEISLTVIGQQILGAWVGEYRPIIPIAFLSASLLHRSYMKKS